MVSEDTIRYPVRLNDIPDDVRFGKEFKTKLELSYSSTYKYPDLSSGMEFTLWEGHKKVAIGYVVNEGQG
jgi:hypothetical protein